MAVKPRSAMLEHDGRAWTFKGEPTGDGVEWIVRGVDGWFGGVGVRGDAVARIGHGEHVERAWAAGRALTLDGYVYADDSADRDRIERDLSGIMFDGTFGRITCDTGAHRLTAEVRRDGEVGIVQEGAFGLAVKIPLRCRTPYLYAEAAHVSVAANGTGVGLIYPLYAPDGVLEYGEADAPTTGTLVNEGNAPAWPVYTFFGDAPTGFRIWQDGHAIEWSGNVGSEPVTVDTAASSVLIGGQDVSELLAVDDFVPIRRGSSAAIRLEVLGGGTGYIDASVASTYS